VSEHGQNKWDQRYAEIAAIASGQEGRIKREQLRDIKLSDATISRWATQKRLIRVHRGVFAVGHLVEPRIAVFKSAILASGDRATVGLDSAAEHWSLPFRYDRDVHVMVPSRRRPIRGVIRHQSSVRDDEFTYRHGVRVVTVARLLVDLAGRGRSRRQLEILMENARAKNLPFMSQLGKLIERYPRRRGVPLLRTIVDGETIGTTLTRSDKEEILLKVLDRFGLPRGVFNARIYLSDGAEKWPDCWYAKEGVAVEVQSNSCHGSWSQQKGDYARTADLAVEGILTLPVAWEQLVDEPEVFARRLRAVLARRANGGR
jgi:hypothetical protein